MADSLIYELQDLVQVMNLLELKHRLGHPIHMRL